MTSTLISLEIVELSLLLLMLSALRPSWVTMRKSNLGLPQLCPFHPSGMPVLPSGCCDQSSTRNVGGSAAERGPLVTSVIASSVIQAVNAIAARNMAGSVSHGVHVLR